MLEKFWKRLKRLNIMIRKRRRKGLKTPSLAAKRRRLRKKIAYLEAHKDPVADSQGTAEWRGRRVAGWMVGAAKGPDGRKVNWFQKFVNHGWDGDLISGWRSPEYSEGLCFDMCGAPTCTYCGGRGSNHSQVGPPNWGAVDVRDYAAFQRANNAVGGPFTNNLPGDLWHRSYTGR